MGRRERRRAEAEAEAGRVHLRVLVQRGSSASGGAAYRLAVLRPRRAPRAVAWQLEHLARQHVAHVEAVARGARRRDDAHAEAGAPPGGRQASWVERRRPPRRAAAVGAWTCESGGVAARAEGRRRWIGCRVVCRPRACGRGPSGVITEPNGAAIRRSASRRARRRECGGHRARRPRGRSRGPR